MTLAFTVYGVAQPKGNMRAIKIKGMKFPIVTESNKSVKSWSQLVAEGASRAIMALPASERQLLEGPVRLTTAFYLPRPKTLSKKKHALLDVAHQTEPDWDKLARAIGDALEQVAYRNDKQIVEAVIGKFYVPIGDVPHVSVRVEPTIGVRLPAVPKAPLPLFA